MSTSGYTPDIGGGPQPSNMITDGTATPRSDFETNGSNATLVISSAGNPARKSITIQNHGTSTLTIAMGATASATTFHYILKSCSSTYDGTGGTIKIDDYTGAISAFSASNLKLSYAEFV
tara:strand:+ start:57184 stop:57543 length:360 start_codon:yes stop_codon:yes gene_type:complete